MNKLKPFLKKTEVQILVLLFILGIVVRAINLTDNINFHYDQGRDAQRVLMMLNEGDIKISGPETDIPGVFNGPIFYYLLALLYGVSGFNINFVAWGFIAINLFGGFLLYRISRILFSSKWIGFIALFLWMISYEQAVFARYISNASLMSISSMLFVYGLLEYIFNKKILGLSISAVGFALAIHFNFYLVYLGIFYPIIFWAYRPNPSLKDLLTNLGIIVFLLSTFILTELLWNFSTIRSMLAYFLEQRDHADKFIDHIELYLEKIAEMSYHSFFAVPEWLSILAITSAIIFLLFKEHRNTKYLFLLGWFFSNAPLFIFRSGVLTVPVISTTIFGASTLLFAAAIYHLLSSKNRIQILLGICIIGGTLISNYYLLSKEEFRSVNLLSTTPLLLRDEKATIDYSYSMSNGNSFSICALTNPLFINSTWSFLYSTYGKDKFGYTPYWSGQPQHLNKSLLSYDTQKGSLRYLILEPLVGIPEEARMATIFMEDQISVIEEEVTFGDITIQKRILSPTKDVYRDSQNLSPDQKEAVEKRISNDPRYSCFVEYN